MNELPHVIRTTISRFAKGRAPLMAFAFSSYFIILTLRVHSEDWGGCEGTSVTIWYYVLLAFLATTVATLIGAPFVELRRRRRAEEAPGPLWRAGLRAARTGVGSLLLFAVVIVGVGVADWTCGEYGPDSAHDTWSPMANRVLDAWSLGACAVDPSSECDVLLATKWVPFRATLAKRACQSKRPGTYAACAAALQEGAIPRDAFCRRDAAMPSDVSVCPRDERTKHRRRLGLIVQGERG